MRLAIVSLAGCDGCQYNLVSEEFMDFARSRGIEIVHWPLVGATGEVDEVDVALVEGSAISERDARTLRDVRSRSRVLVALGSCAYLGGIQGALGESRPLSSHVKVDYYVRGCPVRPTELIDLLDKLAAGLTPLIGERRFGYAAREGQTIGDGLLYLDQHKCIVCGRCAVLCSRIGAGVLNYAHRSTQTLVSTPYGDPFATSGCVHCGLCAAYCPVGAIYYRSDIDAVLAEARMGAITEALLEPEALASLSEAEGLDPLQVVSYLRELGFRRVSVYDPLSNVTPAEGGGIVARSPAERRLIQSLKPEARVPVPKVEIPPGAVFVTVCPSWKSAAPRVVTAREVQMAFRAHDDVPVSRASPDRVVLRPRELLRVYSLAEAVGYLEKGTGELVLYELCPGGCLLGGGQPLSGGKKLGDVLRDRQRRLEEVMERLGKASPA